MTFTYPQWLSSDSRAETSHLEAGLCPTISKPHLELYASCLDNPPPTGYHSHYLYPKWLSCDPKATLEHHMLGEQMITHHLPFPSHRILYVDLPAWRAPPPTIPINIISTAHTYPKLQDEKCNWIEDNIPRQATTIRKRATAFVRAACCHKRTAAMHVLVIIISPEKRNAQTTCTSGEI